MFKMCKIRRESKLVSWSKIFFLIFCQLFNLYLSLSSSQNTGLPLLSWDVKICKQIIIRVSKHVLTHSSYNRFYSGFRFLQNWGMIQSNPLLSTALYLIYFRAFFNNKGINCANHLQTSYFWKKNINPSDP